MNLRYFFFELWGLIVDHGLPLIAFVIIGILLPRMGRLAIRIIEHNLDEQEESTKARLALTGALVYIVQAVAYFLLVAAALTNLGVPALGAAVPATIVSAAVGFGAQSVISDFLSGFFILTEKQFGVGDYVSFAGIPGVEGDVVTLTLRTTKVRTPTGELVTIPNSSAGVVTNYSKEWSRAVVNINVPVHEGESLPEITSRVKEISEHAIEAPDISVDVAGELTVLPATQLVSPQVAGQPWQVGYRIMVTVNPARQWSVERAIRSALLSEFWDHYGSAIDFDELQEQKKKHSAEPKHAAAQSAKDALDAGEGSRPNTPVDDPTVEEELAPEEVELAETKLDEQAVTDEAGEDAAEDEATSRRKICARFRQIRDSRRSPPSAGACAPPPQALWRPFSSLGCSSSRQATQRTRMQVGYRQSIGRKGIRNLLPRRRRNLKRICPRKNLLLPAPQPSRRMLSQHRRPPIRRPFLATPARTPIRLLIPETGTAAIKTGRLTRTAILAMAKGMETETRAQTEIAGPQIANRPRFLQNPTSR